MVQLINSSVYLALIISALTSTTLSQQSFTLVKCATTAPRLPRKDIRALTKPELTKYIAAVKAIMVRPSARSASIYDTFVNVHVTYKQTIHGFPCFFPWHRIYLRQFEILLQKVDPTCTVPYWDWSIDSQAPETAKILTSDYFGGNGAGSSYCVSTGQFTAWKPFYPSSHCLTRKYNSGKKISAFHSTEAINADISGSNSYDALRGAIEYGAHAVVHNNIGRDFSQMVSPNDPLFWSHHAMVDRIWYIWQKTMKKYKDYSGTNSDGTPARLTDRLLPFAETVQQALDPYFLCYYYSTFVPPTTTTVKRRQLNNYNRKPGVSRRFKFGFYRKSMLKKTDLKDVVLKKSRVDAVSYVAPSDRKSIIKLRTPDPIPDDWLIRNNLNVKEARKREANYAKFYAKLNAIPNYVSPCSLVAIPDALKSIATEETTLMAHVNDMDVQLNLGGRTGDEAVDFVLNTVDFAAESASTPAPTSVLETELKQMIGDDTLSDTTAQDIPRPLT